MTKIRLNFLLMGKTGQGKSATGNTILNSSFFKVSSRLASETKYVTNCFSKFENYGILVVDGPGLEDTAMSKVQDKITAARNMDKALAMCYGGVDAFLFILKFGNRFTNEDKTALKALKKIFGDDFKKYVIVVMTCGDLFHGAMEEEGPSINFQDWCEEQTDKEFRKLYKECEGRVVLFNNKEKDEGRKRAQMHKLVELAESLHQRHGRYTSRCFEMANQQRQQLINEVRAPELKETYQKKICSLTAEIRNYSEQPSEIKKITIQRTIEKIRAEIDTEGEGFSVLLELRTLIREVEEYLNDVEKLITLVNQLESIRQAKKAWCILGTICAVVSGVIAIVALPIGLGLVGCSAAVTGTAFGSLTYKEKKAETELQEIKEKQF